MTALRKVVIVRHGDNVKAGEDPSLTNQGVKEAKLVGFHLDVMEGLKNPTFITSPKRRCTQTAKIIRRRFWKTWLHPRKYTESELFFVSARAGDMIDEPRTNAIIEFILQHTGDVIIVTHHQLADGKLLSQLAHTLGYVDNILSYGKSTPGSAYMLNCNNGEVGQICGAVILDLDAP